MNFLNWLLNEENSKRIIKIPFSQVKFNTIDKYYVDLNKTKAMLASDDGVKEPVVADDVEIGDLVEDMVMSAVPYWKVHDIDTDKNIIYLEPYGNNPFVPNASGEIVGAGGKKFDKHDFDVMSGEYEKNRIDDILDIINNKKYHDIGDIAYILLGTVPVQVGPNGSQGGWYNVSDGNNRGSMKGMEVSEIIAKDANTLKNKLGFDVPESALSGMLDKRDWNDFVKGQTQRWDLNKTQLPFEDFNDADKMSKIVLGKYPPAIRKRNLEKLLDLGYKSDEYDDLIHKVALELASQTVLDDNFDRLWHIKEALISFARNKGWDDVMSIYEDAHDEDNQADVARHYGESKQLDKLLSMLDKTKASKAIRYILVGLSEIGMHTFEKYSSFISPEAVKNHFDSNPDDKVEAMGLLKKILPVVSRNMSKIRAAKKPPFEIDFEQPLRRLQILQDVLMG